jgi:phosphoribosylaminoimidazole-succinocarboxamide synthase
MSNDVVMITDIAGLPQPRRGKVRDIYETEDALLIVATDRVSAFDVVLPDGIPGKGRVLTQVSRFWFNFLSHIIPNHVISMNADDFPAPCRPYREMLTGRSMLVKKAQPLPVECIVRGYLAGSGWQGIARQERVRHCTACRATGRVNDCQNLYLHRQQKRRQVSMTKISLR